MTFQDERDEVPYYEPILAKKKAKVKIQFAEPATWTVKDKVIGYAGQEKKACKLNVLIIDQDVRCEHADAKPRRQFDDQFNVEKYPYMDKTGEVKFMNRGKLFDFETAFGFEACFVDKNGAKVEAHVTKSGNKVAPKGEGIARVLNPDFVAAYLHADGTVNPTNWIDKELLADIDVEESEQYGNKNIATRYYKLDSN